MSERERSEEKIPWSRRLASMQEQSRKAFEELDPGDIDAAIELGQDICKELGICCVDKGKVMFQVFKSLREQKAKEGEPAARAAAADLARKEGLPAVAEMLEAGVAPPVESAPAAGQPSGKLEVLEEKTEEGGKESA